MKSKLHSHFPVFFCLPSLDLKFLVLFRLVINRMTNDFLSFQAILLQQCLPECLLECPLRATTRVMAPVESTEPDWMGSSNVERTTPTPPVTEAGLTHPTARVPNAPQRMSGILCPYPRTQLSSWETVLWSGPSLPPSSRKSFSFPNAGPSWNHHLVVSKLLPTPSLESAGESAQLSPVTPSSQPWLKTRSPWSAHTTPANP